MNSENSTTLSGHLSIPSQLEYERLAAELPGGNGHGRLATKARCGQLWPLIEQAVIECHKILLEWGCPCEIHSGRLIAASKKRQLVVATCWERQTQVLTKPYFQACISDLDVFSLYLLSLCFWGNGEFLPSIGNGLRLTTLQRGDRIVPDGYEMEAYWKGDERAAERIAFPAWTAIAVSEMSRDRILGCQQMFRHAVRQMWLHELGHLQLGHAARELSMVSRVPCSLPPWLGWACEFQSDMFAASQQQARFPIGSALPNTNYAIAYVGALLPMLLVRGAFVLRSKNAEADDPHHPPVFARAYVVRDEFELGRNTTHSYLLDAVHGQISRVSQVFAEWLEPVRDREGYSAYRNMRNEADEQIKQWQTEFEVGCVPLV